MLDGAVRAVDALAPDAVIQGGDLIDNAQANELAWALAALRGGRVQADSGAPGYFGVQWAGDPDPFYYRPDLDAPRHPGMLTAATSPFAARGLKSRWYPVLGDHDLLVQGVLAPTPLTDQIARGSRAVWELPTDLRLEAGLGAVRAAGPDGLPAGGLLEPPDPASCSRRHRSPSRPTSAGGSSRRAKPFRPSGEPAACPRKGRCWITRSTLASTCA